MYVFDVHVHVHAELTLSHFSTQLRLVQQRIGYCPQFDALLERLTGRQLLTMFARLRGIPESEIKKAVQTEINRLDLTKHANKKCGTYRFVEKNLIPASQFY